LKSTLTDIITKALQSSIKNGVISGESLPVPVIEMTRDRKFGDYATNIAMVLASGTKNKPRELADLLSRQIMEADSGETLDKAETAGPGFINLTMNQTYWKRALETVLVEGGRYAESTSGKGKKVQVEFVSANPTGPLHVGHGRGAALGDALANVLECAGFQVEREYYINDAGNQIHTLGKSVFARYMELSGVKVDFPADGYQGDYIRDHAKAIYNEYGRVYLDMQEEQAVEEIAVVAAGRILEDIMDDLEEFGVTFDVWFSERSLFDRDKVDSTLVELEESGHLFRKEGALWFRTIDTGDDKDRVVVKSDGSYTYFASDVAYHRDKYLRGFDQVINIWGADHHGYIPRMKAAVQSLGRNADDLEIVLVQLVNLLRKGRQVAMSTRAGEFVTLREVRDEVGKDAARFIFLTRKADSKLDFDLDLAKEKSNDNPVYYVQYAHARICSILRNAEEAGAVLPALEEIQFEKLNLPEEKELVRHLASLPDVISMAAHTLEPHRLTNYLRDLAATLHSYYYHYKVLSDDEGLTGARLALVTGVKTAIQKVLSLLGVSSPERM